MGSPGFKTIVLQPHVFGDLTSARATYDSVQGRIESDWKITGNQFLWQVTVPANTTAIVMVPNASPDSITEGGQPINKAQGLQFLRLENGAAVFAAEPGSYNFSCPAKSAS